MPSPAISPALSYHAHKTIWQKQQHYMVYQDSQKPCNSFSDALQQIKCLSIATDLIVLI